MLLLEELSQGEITALPLQQTIVIVPVAPLERHGPHLPVGTDLFISSALSRQLAEKIESRWPDVTVVLTPLIPLGVQPVPGPGSVRTRQRPFHDALFDFVQSLARSDFRFVAICSAHGSIGHFVALEEVAHRASKELNIRVEPVLSGVIIPFLAGRYIKEIEGRLGRTLESQERKHLLGDCHGGQWETAAMLKIRPDLVHESYRTLEPVLMKGWLQLRECMTESCRQGLGYVGAPADASLEYGVAAAETILERIIERLDRMIHAPHFRPSHTFFYYWPPYRTRPIWNRSGLQKAVVAAFTTGALIGCAAGAAVTYLSTDRRKK